MHGHLNVTHVYFPLITQLNDTFVTPFRVFFYFHLSPVVARQRDWPNPNNGSKRSRINGIAGRDDDAQRGKEEARK